MPSKYRIRSKVKHALQLLRDQSPMSGPSDLPAVDLKPDRDPVADNGDPLTHSPEASATVSAVPIHVSHGHGDIQGAQKVVV